MIIEVPSGTYPVVIGSNLNHNLRGVIGRMEVARQIAPGVCTSDLFLLQCG